MMKIVNTFLWNKEGHGVRFSLVLSQSVAKISVIQCTWIKIKEICPKNKTRNTIIHLSYDNFYTKIYQKM